MLRVRPSGRCVLPMVLASDGSSSSSSSGSGMNRENDTNDVHDIVLDGNDKDEHSLNLLSTFRRARTVSATEEEEMLVTVDGGK